MRTLQNRHGPSRSTGRGFTLVEALIAGTLLAFLFLAVAQTSSRASDAFDEGSAEHMLSTTTHRCLERITQEIEFADGGILASPGITDPALGADQVTFRVPTGWTGTEVNWSSNIVIRTELEPGELNDGKDNDGDELVDELRVVEIERGPAGRAPRRARERRGELYDGEREQQGRQRQWPEDRRGLSFSASGDGHRSSA
jgi:hypothetical protein